MIQTVFFDLGKVLADFNWKSAAHKIAEKSTLSPGEVYTLCTNSTMALQYETGKIGTKLFFERLGADLNFDGSPELLSELWSDIFTPIHKHVALVDKMRLKYAVGLISNTNEAHVRWITEKFGFLNWFPKPTYSFIAGYLKPQKEIYIEALRAMSVTAGKSLFVDDLEGNVSAALKLGMSAIHLTPDKDLEHELRSFGLKGF